MKKKRREEKTADRLEEIRKKIPELRSIDNRLIPIPNDDALWLIHEVERLRKFSFEVQDKEIASLTKEVGRLRRLESCDVFIKHHGGIGLAQQIVEEQETLASLTKELGAVKATNSSWGSEVRRVEQKNNKLEAENAELKEEAKRWSLDMGQVMEENSRLQEKVEGLEDWTPTCDFVGCDKLVTCGTPQKNGLYASTCGDHRNIAWEGA